MLSSLSAFFPCYNEEQNIPVLVDRACSYLPTITNDFEVIIVDDGSTDNTTQVIKRIQKKCQELRVVSHEHNRGYGAALRTGIEASQKDWIFWSDGDLQFDIKTLQGFLPYVDDFDVIIGYRAHRADTFLRKVIGEVYTQLINLLFGIGVRDIDCAFKLIKASQIRELEIESSGAFTSAEILIRLHERGVAIKQLPVSHFPRTHGRPTGAAPAVIIKALKETIYFYLRHRRIKSS